MKLSIWHSPAWQHGLDVPGKHLGGLGHIAVKFGKAFGMKVTVISASPKKEKEAIEHLGADVFLAAMGTMDGIINPVSADHAITPLPLLLLLKTHGGKSVIELIRIDYLNKDMERLAKADVRYRFDR
ncbi:putative mannitol dehydrogenase [Curcuma longa]|uniref:putative mannitol dehydrogenase n=1 Tax=Curcuma longa TaxID=136217 RepID=UPI003D9F65BF